jgi:hypothetical protein
LQGEDIIITRHDDDGLVFEALSEVHGTDSDPSFRLLQPFGKLKLNMPGGFDGSARPYQFIL